MSENETELEQLGAAERVIRALEKLTFECEARNLNRFAQIINECTSKCQAEYIEFHRRLYDNGGGPASPSKTEH